MLARDAGANVTNDRRRTSELRAEIGRLTEAIATVGISPALGERLRASELALDAMERAPTRAGVTSLPAAMRARVRALADGLECALREETPRAREALRAAFGEIRLVADGEVPPHVDRVLNKPPRLRELRGPRSRGHWPSITVSPRNIRFPLRSRMRPLDTGG